MTDTDWLNDLERWYDEATRNLPKFDRVCVRDPDWLLQQMPHATERTASPLEVAPLHGFPVVTDETLPPGRIQLRLGDDVYAEIDVTA